MHIDVPKREIAGAHFGQRREEQLSGGKGASWFMKSELWQKDWRVVFMKAQAKPRHLNLENGCRLIETRCFNK